MENPVRAVCSVENPVRTVCSVERVLNREGAVWGERRFAGADGCDASVVRLTRVQLDSAGSVSDSELESKSESDT